MIPVADLLDEARDAAGLKDYGDLAFTEGLEVLVGSVNAEAGLTPENDAALRTEIVRVLVNRLRMQRDIAEHPEILDEEILPPLFITSLPRTGSTKLHRMLAATGDFAGMPFWMSHNFAPFPAADGSGGADGTAGADEQRARVEDAREYLGWLEQRVPLYLQAHPHYAEDAEEEMSLLDAGFNSLYRWAAFLNVPTYINWVLGRDGMAGFRDLTVMLRYLQWQHYRGQGKRWVLKTPSLFGWEGAYAQNFPGMDFIVTHRQPAVIWPSVCTLFSGVRSVYNETPIPELRVMGGQVMLHNFSEGLNGHLAWRDAYPPEKVFDARFSEVIGDEAALLRRIYDWLGMEFTATAENNLAAWLKMDAERGHTRNLGTLDDCGITEAFVEERLSGYIEHYAEFL